jgi:hypothetical protein
MGPIEGKLQAFVKARYIIFIKILELWGSKVLG